MRYSFVTAVAALLSMTGSVAAQVTESSLTTFVDTCTLPFPHNPIRGAYWTGYIRHARTPFALSPDGTVAYLAWLDASETDVHVQPIDPTTFAAKGTPVTVTGGKEAGGLVALDDGFALLTNEALPTGTQNAPADSTPVAVLYRFDASGTQKWKTWLGGPTINDDMGHLASPDINGDLVFSSVTGYFAAYIVVTAYDGSAAGHFGDAIRYVSDKTGEIVVIEGASSSWGCSHNTGICLEAADEAPYASCCAEDQGAIWLNTVGQGMSTVGTKISNENTTNGAGGESMGAMSGSYSNLARWQNSKGYIYTWVSRGAVNLYENAWMGAGYTAAYNRTNGRNVAIALFTDKQTMVESQASSEVGAASGDDQVTWVTTSTTADQSNAHVATFSATQALVVWEEIADPFCEFIAFGCRGTFTGAYYQLVNSDGTLVGKPYMTKDVTVSGDMVTFGDGKICWPYVSGPWDLAEPVSDYGGTTGSTVTKISFACMKADGSASTGTTAATPATTPQTTAAEEPVAAVDTNNYPTTVPETPTTKANETVPVPNPTSSCKKHTKKTVFVYEN